MAVFVIDASIAAAWCFKDESTDYTDAVLTAVSGPSDALAPRLGTYELRNSVLMGLRRGRIGKADALRFPESLPLLRIRFTDPPDYDQVFEMAHRHGLTVYDAAYLDLAVREGLPLASLDATLIRAAQTAGMRTFRP